MFDRNFISTGFTLAVFIVTGICFYIPGFIHAVASGSFLEAVTYGGMSSIGPIFVAGFRPAFRG